MVALSIVVGVLVLWCIAVTLQITEQTAQIRKLRGKLKLALVAIEDHEKRILVLEELPPCVSSLGKVKKQREPMDDIAEALIGGLANHLAEDDTAPPFLRRMGAIIVEVGGKSKMPKTPRTLEDMSLSELNDYLSDLNEQERYEDAGKVAAEISKRKDKTPN